MVSFFSCSSSKSIVLYLVLLLERASASSCGHTISSFGCCAKCNLLSICSWWKRKGCSCVSELIICSFSTIASFCVATRRTRFLPLQRFRIRIGHVLVDCFSPNYSKIYKRSPPTLILNKWACTPHWVVKLYPQSSAVKSKLRMALGSGTLEWDLQI